MLILRVKNIYKINSFISFYKKKWFHMFIVFINIIKNDKLKRTICKIGILSQNDPFIKKYIYIRCNHLLSYKIGVFSQNDPFIKNIYIYIYI